MRFVKFSFLIVLLGILTGMTCHAAPIHDQARDGHLKEVSEILKKAPKQLQAKDFSGNTPLHLAARNGRSKVVNLLIERGARIEVKNDEGLTPLAMACTISDSSVGQDGKVHSAILLIDRGARVNASDKRGWTPLHRAVYGGYLKIVKLLIKRGADVNAKTKEGETPLSYALNQNGPEIQKILKANGAK